MGKQRMDETFDFVVVGSGAGSMCAALVMRSAGKRVLVLEKTEMLGGTTSTAGGVMWIPDNHYMKLAGVKDCRQRAVEYLDALADDGAPAPGATRARRLAYVEEGPKMLEFLASQGIRLRRLPSWPDYYDRPGASEASRTVASELFDLNRLGEWKSKLRPNFLPFPVTIDEAMLLPWFKKMGAARLVMAKMAFRSFAAKLTGKQWVTAGAALQGQMLHAALKAGVDIRLNATVKRILTEGDRVTGVSVELDGREQQIGASLGVLINAGGFSRNQAMRDRYAPGTSVDWTNTAPGDTGEVMQEAIRIGAAVAQMEERVGNPMALPPGAGAIKPMVQGDMAKPHAIVVDQQGQRFMNEAQSYVELSRRLLERDKLSPAVPSWVVVDSKYHKDYMLVGTMPGSPKPQAWFDAGFLRKGDTVEELARACGMDPRTLRATVERFNGFVRNGRDADFQRGDWAYHRWLGDPTLAGAAQTLGTLTEGPFYAFQVYPGDVGTFGGLVTDPNAQVLRPDGTVIAGLYATGTSTASVMGARSAGAGASIGPGFTFGYVAAKHAAHAGNLAMAKA